MGNRVRCARAFGIVVVALCAAFLFQPVSAHAGNFWPGFPHSDPSPHVKKNLGDILVDRLCERQEKLGDRLRHYLIDPNICNPPPPPEKPTLTLVKTVINDNGGTAVANDFQAKIDGINVAWSVAHDASAGAHTASETSLAGYSAGAWGGDCAADGSVTLAAGEEKTCTITNDDIAPQAATLTLVKEVVNDDGGTTTVDAWTLLADGPTDISGVTGSTEVTSATVAVGTYALSESGGPSGYSASEYSCVKNGGAAVSGNSLTLADGDVAVCTITNDDAEGTLIVKKVVIRDNGGDVATSTFSFQIHDGAAVNFEADGQNDMAVNAGIYTIVEVALDGFTTSYENCTNVIVSSGETETCIVTNNDTPPQTATLTLIKNVINDNGGTTTAEAWTLTATGPTNISGISGSAAVTNATVTPGLYELSESGGPSGYTASVYTCSKNEGPDVDSNSITLANGDVAVCTITNNDQQGTLHVVKVVTNDDGGTATADNFSFQVDGGSAVSFEADGQNDVTVNAGVHSITEPAVAGYASSLENCTDVYVSNGGEATCTVTNDDVGQMIGHLVISEVLYNAASTTIGVESQNEWVEIYNGGVTAVDLLGWSIGDASASTTINVSVSIAPGDFVVVIASSTPAGIPGGVQVINLDTSLNPGGLANTGDAIFLRDAANATVDAVSWGSNTTAFTPAVAATALDGNSIARISLTADADSATDWNANVVPTPGQ